MKKILLMGILFCWGVSSFAYEFRAGSITRQEAIAPAEQQTDDNGDVLSVLLVQSDVNGMVFDGAVSAEKTADGYAVYIPAGTGALLLRAPQVKALKWTFPPLEAGFYYQAVVDRQGVPARDNEKQFPQKANLQYDMLDISWVVLQEQNPSREAILSINTDLPFPILQKRLLKEGSYTGPVEAEWYVQTYPGWNTLLTPPYKILVRPGSLLKDIVRSDGLVKETDWNFSFQDSKGTYILDLTY